MANQHTPLTDQQLDDIDARAAALYEYTLVADEEGQAEADQLTGTDVPALIAEVRRGRRQRKFLVDQLARKDAASGEGDKALREFLAAHPDEGEIVEIPGCPAAGDSGTNQ